FPFIPGDPIVRPATVQWWQVGTDANILQRALIIRNDSFVRAYPTIAVSRQEDVLIGYSRFCSGGFADTAYSFRNNADLPNSLQDELPLKAAEGPYSKDFGTGDVRWGDYSNSAVDPLDDLGLWTIQEYAASGSDPQGTWGTWWGAIPPPGNLARLQIVTVPGGTAAAAAGVPLDDLEVFGADSNGRYVAGFTGTIHFTSSDPRAVLPADYTFTAADKGFHHFSGVTLFHAGQVGITVTDTANVLPPHTVIINVNPAPTAVFLISSPNPVTAGATNNFSVTAQDTYQNVTPGYFGMVSFSSTDPQATLPASYTYSPFFDNGAHTFAATLKTAGFVNFYASDAASGAYGNAVIQVNPAAASQLILSAPANVTRTKQFLVEVTAKDRFSNLATGYTGTVQFTSTDAAASTPAPYAFKAADQGRHNFSITLNTLGPTQPDLTAIDTANSLTANASINVLAISGSARRV